MSIWIFVQLALAASLLTMLLVEERGPFKVFRRFRLRLGIRYHGLSENPSDLLGQADLENNDAYALGELGELFLCSRCTGLWVSFILFVLVEISVVPFWIITMLAGAKLVILIEAYS